MDLKDEKEGHSMLNKLVNIFQKRILNFQILGLKNIQIPEETEERESKNIQFETKIWQIKINFQEPLDGFFIFKINHKRKIQDLINPIIEEIKNKSQGKGARIEGFKLFQGNSELDFSKRIETLQDLHSTGGIDVIFEFEHPLSMRTRPFSEKFELKPNEKILKQM